MNQHERSRSHPSEHVEGSTRKDHYYVQALTERIFLVRECLSVGGEPNPDDRIVRSFDVYHDAHIYANTMNSQPERPASTAAPDSSSLAE